MPKLPLVSSKELIMALKKFGYGFDRQKGSHVILVKESEHRICVPVRDALPKGTLRAILRHCGISKESLHEALGKHKH